MTEIATTATSAAGRTVGTSTRTAFAHHLSRPIRFAAATALALAAAAFASGSMWLDGTTDGARSRALATIDVPVPPRYRAYADCLWPTARNHGFFDVQMRAIAGGDEIASDGTITDSRAAATRNADAATRALWRDFLASAGADACAGGSSDIVANMPSLEQALADTREAARQHFAAP